MSRKNDGNNNDEDDDNSNNDDDDDDDEKLLHFIATFAFFLPSHGRNTVVIRCERGTNNRCIVVVPSINIHLHHSRCSMKTRIRFIKEIRQCGHDLVASLLRIQSAWLILSLVLWP